MLDSEQASMGTMDYIIDTVSAIHALAPLLGLLKLNGKLVTVGLPNKPLDLPIASLVIGEAKSIYLVETEKVLRKCFIIRNEKEKIKKETKLSEDSKTIDTRSVRS